MRRVREVIVVEGRYDKNALRQAVDATVVETKGFGVFNDRERLALLRRLAEWKNNDVVKLAFLDPENADRVDRLDLTGVAELKRNANGAFEVKFVDKVRVLAMLRELMEERRDGALEDFLDGLCQRTDGDDV